MAVTFEQIQQLFADALAGTGQTMVQRLVQTAAAAAQTAAQTSASEKMQLKVRSIFTETFTGSEADSHDRSWEISTVVVTLQT